MQQCAGSQVSGINMSHWRTRLIQVQKRYLPHVQLLLVPVAENHSRNFMFEHMDELVMPYLLRETNRARLDSLQGRTAFPFFLYNPVKGHNGGTEFLF